MIIPYNGILSFSQLYELIIMMFLLKDSASAPSYWSYVEDDTEKMWAEDVSRGEEENNEDETENWWSVLDTPTGIPLLYL